MNDSIKTELQEYTSEYLQDGWDGRTADDLHHELFNLDYYIVGYYAAEQWLNKHNVTVFQALEYVQDWERDHTGEARMYHDAERLVNMLVYIAALDVVHEMLEAA